MSDGNGKLEANAAYGKADAVSAYPDMTPRITVRDHNDLHMLIVLMRDAVEHLKTVPGAGDRLLQADTMLVDLERLHGLMIDQESQEALDSIVNLFAAAGVTVVEIQL